MLVIGLLLIILSVAFGALVIAFNASEPTTSIMLFGQQIASMNPVQVFIAGFALALIFCIGIWMVAATERRRKALRADYKSVRSEAAEAKIERDHLAEQLNQQQTPGGQAGVVGS